MDDIEAIVVRVIELIPEIIEKKPELAFKMFETLKKYFVPLELFKEYLKKLDKIEKKVDKIEEDVAGLKRDVGSLKEDVAGLKRDVGSLKEDVAGLKRDVGDMKVSIDRLMLSLEEEAREYIKWWLGKHDIKVDPRSEVICGMEINLFDDKGAYVLIGDATVRAGPRVVEWIYNRAKKLAKCAPRYKDREFIIVIYAMHFTPDTIEIAKKYGVWLLSATKEITKFKTTRINAI